MPRLTVTLLLPVPKALLFWSRSVPPATASEPGNDRLLLPARTSVLVPGLRQIETLPLDGRQCQRQRAAIDVDLGSRWTALCSH